MYFLLWILLFLLVGGFDYYKVVVVGVGLVGFVVVLIFLDYGCIFILWIDLCFNFGCFFFYIEVLFNIKVKLF